MRQRIRLALAGLALASASIFFTAPARAADYSGDCAHASTFDGNGNVDITDGACTLGNINATGYVHINVSSLTAGGFTAGTDLSVTVTGPAQMDALFSGDTITVSAAGDLQTSEIVSPYAINITNSGGDTHVTGGIHSTYDEVNINSSNGDVTLDNGVLSGGNTIINGNNVTSGYINSNYGVHVSAANGALSLQNVVSNASDGSNGGNILLTATGNIGVGTVTNQGQSTTGGIEIRANTSGSSTVFNLGGGGSNGSGTLTTTNTTGGGTNPDFIVGGVYVTNGVSGSTGGISVNSASSIAVNSSGSRSGIIILDANDGTITLPSGSINSDGAPGYGAGQINLLANTIATTDGTIISASQATGTTGTHHGVAIAAQSITTTGSTGFVIHADGDGTNASDVAIVALMPEGGATATSTEDVNNLYWTISYNNYFSLDGSLTVSGSGAFTATANGTNTEVAATGYPVSFTNGNVTLQSVGPLNNSVYIGYNGTFTGTTGVAFTGSGDVVIDASGNGGNGGIAQIYSDQANITAPSFTMKVNGPTTGAGNGGSLVFEPTSASISSTFSLQANGASGGTGNGGNLTFYMSQASIGGNSFDLEANGASGGNGDGGTILAQTYPNDMTLSASTTATISANASSAGTGNAAGAAVTFSPGTADFNIGTGAGQFAFAARGGSTGGNGGGLFINGYSSAVTVYGAGETSPLDVSAPGGTGNGGQLYLTAYNGLTFDGDASVLTADSGTTSGNGGLIQIQTSVNAVVIGTGTDGDVTLTATGQGNGNGGTVNIQSYYGITADTTCIDVSSAGDGTGGTITLNAEYSGLTLNGSLNASSQAMGNGAGGQINLTGGYIYLAEDANTTLTADSNGTGNAGSISVMTNFGDVTVSDADDALSLEAASNGSGNGGSVTINSAGAVTADGATVDVSAGSGSGGTGGNITMTATGDITLSNELNATGGCDTGDGGNITLTGNDVTTDGADTSAGDGSCPAIAAAQRRSLQPRTSGNGNAHNIVINANNRWLTQIPFRPLKAKAFADGNGGSITINNSVGIDLSAENTELLTAKGSGTGQGGTVSINNVSTLFDVNTVVKVSAGNGVTNSTTIDGVISLNGVGCQQWFVDNGSGAPRTSWPLTFWDCTANSANPSGSPDGIDLVPSTLATNASMSSLQATFGGTNNDYVQIYVFPLGGTIASRTGYNAFFVDTQGPLTGGVTLKVGNHVYINPWQHGSIGQNEGDPTAYDNNQYKEVTAHEFGHAVDISFGVANDSQSGTYNTWLVWDSNTLDYADAAHTVQRLPCALTPIDPNDLTKGYYSGGIPFSGVTDINAGNAQICVDGALNPDLGFPANPFNSQILANLEPIWNPPVDKKWIEVHAQLFGYNLVGNQNARPMNDKVLDNGYFPCLKHWASIELTNAQPIGSCNLTP